LPLDLPVELCSKDALCLASDLGLEVTLIETREPLAAPSSFAHGDAGHIDPSIWQRGCARAPQDHHRADLDVKPAPPVAEQQIHLPCAATGLADRLTPGDPLHLAVLKVARSGHPLRLEDEDASGPDEDVVDIAVVLEVEAVDQRPSAPSSPPAEDRRAGGDLPDPAEMPTMHARSDVDNPYGCGSAGVTDQAAFGMIPPA